MASQAGLEEVRQLGVAVGDVAALGGKGGKNVANAREALVDRASLGLPLTLGMAPVQPLAPCQVDEAEAALELG